MRARTIQTALKLKSVVVDWVFLTSPTAIRYISGFNGSEGALLISKDKQYLLVDGRYTSQARQQAPEFEVVECENGILSQLEEFEIRSLGYEAKYMSVKKFDMINELLPEVILVDITYLVEDMRECKTEEEVDKLKKAAKIANQTFSHIRRYIRPGMSERQVALEIEYDMRRQGATATSFDTIVASGQRTAMPHAKPTEKIIEIGDFVMMDFGCVADGYCSDTTRMVIMGQPTDKQQKIYDIVLEAQLMALANIKEGITAREADAFARGSIKNAGYGDKFTHSLGHGVGMDVHEKPSVSPKNENPLKAGMIISVEPGIYLPGEFGVRIEDVVRVTESGLENLTTIDKSLIVI